MSAATQSMNYNIPVFKYLDRNTLLWAAYFIFASTISQEIIFKLLQVKNFPNVSFVYHFIKEFE